MKHQVEKKSNGTKYNANGHRTKDTMKILDADGKTVNSLLSYEYDPMDRLMKYIKTGDNATSESYKLDANHNIIEQMINGSITTYNYDRNRHQVVSVLFMGRVAIHGEAQRRRQQGGLLLRHNTRTHVEVLTDENGNIRATYGYTAYGSSDEKAFTGVDKPDPVNPDKEVYNVYRYSANAGTQQRRTTTWTSVIIRRS